MTAELEQALQSAFKTHYAVLLEQGRREVIADEVRQHERGDEWVIGGQVTFEAKVPGYALLLSYSCTIDEELKLLDGAPSA